MFVNKAAPLSSVGVYVVDPGNTFTTNGTGVNGNLIAPINKTDAHFLYSNRAYAQLVGNPYPGEPRNINRGQSFNNLDVAIEKSTPITERVSVRLYLNAFNVLNRAFLGTPDTSIENGSATGISVFGSNRFNGGNYDSTGIPASRYIQLGGKVTF